MRARLFAGRNAWHWLWPLSVALVVRVVRGYRGFPSIDEFAYIPFARATLDPTLYRNDWIMQRVPHHSPLWTLVVGAADRSLGVPVTLWLATIVLTIATVFAAARLLRRAGLPPYTLPMFVAIGFIGHVQGLGRGAYDGALGNGFHAQWVSICLLLWCYDAFAQSRPVRAGILLGVATLAHPVVGLHGAFVLGVATLVVRGPAWRELALSALACAIVSAPIALSIAPQMGNGGPSAWPVTELVRLGLLFRNPNHYSLTDVSVATLSLVGLLALCGLASAAVFDGHRRSASRRRLVGVGAGHFALLAVALLLNGPLGDSPLARASLLPYQLDLTRTTPLAIVFSTLLLMTAVWNVPRDAASRDRKALWLALAFALALIATIGTGWPLPIALLAACAIGARVLKVPHRTTAMAGGLTCLVLVAAAWVVRSDRHDAPPPPTETAELFRWARGSSDRDAVFVVPPGFRSFRLHAERAVYADFEMIPFTSPADLMEWRRRLELVADPDSLARQQGGWKPGMMLWDRSYAVRNTPVRVASLLRETGARYVVWDSLAAEIPPYTPLRRSEHSAVRVAFGNTRYKVYELSGDASTR